jgi:hypothetical protein
VYTLEFERITALWQMSGRSDSSMDIVVLQHYQSKGGMNNFVTEATASVIKGMVM